MERRSGSAGDERLRTVEQYAAGTWIEKVAGSRAGGHSC